MANGTLDRKSTPAAMRLFPHTWEGLHPAFPEDSRPSESCISVPLLIPVNLPLISPGSLYGISAFVCVFASGFIKRPALPYSQTHKHSRNGRSLSVAIKATVFAAAASGVMSLNDQLTQHANGPRFLRCRHIEPPKPKFIDRIEHWDQDNWTVLGAVAGVALASRRPCVFSQLGRPVWYAIHGIAGSFIGNFGLAAWEIRSRGLGDYILGEQNQVAALQRVSYMPEVIRELFLGQMNPYKVIGALKKGDIKLSFELIAGLKDRIRPVTEEAVMRARDSNTNRIEALFRTPNNSNGPHKTLTPSASPRLFHTQRGIMTGLPTAPEQSLS